MFNLYGIVNPPNIGLLGGFFVVLSIKCNSIVFTS